MGKVNIGSLSEKFCCEEKQGQEDVGTRVGFAKMGDPRSCL